MPIIYKPEEHCNNYTHKEPRPSAERFSIGTEWQCGVCSKIYRVACSIRNENYWELISD